MTKKVVALVLLAALVLAACGTSQTPAPARNATTTPATTPKTAPSPKCSEPSVAFVQAVEQGLRKPSTELGPGAYYVKTNKQGSVWMVGIEAAGGIATFGTSADPAVDEVSGLIIAANPLARTLTDWGEAAQPGSPAAKTFADPADVSTVLKCWD